MVEHFFFQPDMIKEHGFSDLIDFFFLLWIYYCDTRKCIM